MKDLESFLEFNGRRLSVLSKDGQWWIAVKPICEALGVEYTRTFKNIKEDEILSELLAEQPMVGADKKVRNMVCLPEKFIYGWLFSIRSESPALKEYKRKCYEVLYNHFHGAMTDRVNVLSERDRIDLRILELEEKLQETDEYLEILELKKQKTKTGKDLKRLDVELKTRQLSFSFS